MYKYAVLIIASILLLMVFPNKLFAQNTALKFTSLTTREGLSSNSVFSHKSILQDSRGFIWIGTFDGLNRYDGYNFKIYRHQENNPNSLSDNLIIFIFEDSSGKLWVLTSDKKLHSYNPLTDQFTPFKFISNDGSPVKLELIDDIVEDTPEKLWLRDKNNYLFNVNTTTGRFTRYDRGFPEGALPSLIVILFKDSQSILWIGTNKWLERYDPVTDTLVKYKHDPDDPHSLTKGRINSIYEDKSGRLWIGNQSGINRYDRQSNQFINYPLPKALLPDNNQPGVYSITEDSQGWFWFSTDRHEGLIRFKPDSGEFTHFQHDLTQPDSLCGNQISEVYFDRTSWIWVSTNGNGVCYADINALQFGYIQPGNRKSGANSSNNVYTLLYDSQGDLWIGTSGGGLHRHQQKDGQHSHFQHQPGNPLSLANDNLRSLFEDSSGQLWVGFTQGILSRYDPQQQGFIQYPGSPEVIMNLIEDQQGNIWIASLDKRLSQLDKTTGEFVHYQIGAGAHYGQGDGLNEAVIFIMINAKNGNLWLGNARGLIQFNPKDKRSEYFFHQKDDPASLTKGWVMALYEDLNEVLWIGTIGGGLGRYDPITKQFTSYTTSDGLSGNTVYSIEEDFQGALWVSTDKGLSKIIPETMTIRNYRVEDGLQGNDFHMNASSISNKGELFFGGVNGFNRFFPEKIVDEPLAPDLLLTDFKLFNQSVSIVPASGKPEQSNRTDEKIALLEFQLEQSIMTAEHLLLGPRESFFSFDFAAINARKPNNILYAYQLEGWDENWIETDADNRRATYTNIPPGDYVFNVRASDPDGYWEEVKTSLAVTILPPWWMSVWAKILYVALLISLLSGFYSYRTASLRQRATELEKTVEHRTMELAEEKSKVEKMLQQKTEEFANVSHEFRTPLTLILGPLAQLLKDKLTTQQVSRLNIIQRNGYRLLRMVDQLLNLETFRAKPVTQRLPINTAQTIRTLTEAFTDLANDKEIKLELNQLAEANFEFTADAFEKIVLNLLSNALKYTKSGGLINVETTRENNQLILQITDTGIGIPSDKLDEIFERFNRVLDKNSEQVTGAGIGLALVKSLVESHQGTIEITSELNQGTCVKVIFPIINEVDKNQVNSQSNLNSSNNEIIEMEIVSLTEQAKQTTANEKTSSLPQENQQPTILVIEDNQDMQDFIVGSLGEDYQILTASNGEEGIKLAKQEVPDLIISDIMMPKKDGFETTKELRNDDLTNHIPIILLTALGDHENRMRGWQEKADEYLTKPFNTEELKTRIANLLAIRNILKRRFGETVFEQKETSDEIESSLVNDLSIAEKNKNQLQQQFVKMINEKLEKRYSDASVLVEDLADSLAMSERQIFRKLKSTLDMTPTEYLRRFRLEKAKEQLKKGCSATNTAFDVGFSSQSYFAKCFKAQYGLSPTEYIRQN